MICKLSEITKTISKGSTPRGKLNYNSQTGINFLKVTDLNNLEPLYSTSLKLSDEEVEKYKVKVWPVNTVLISIEGTVGKVSILKNKMAINQAIAGLIPNEKVIPEYLMYLLADKNTFRSMIKGTIMPALRLDDLKNITIDLPSLDVQEKIVRVLSSLDNKNFINNKKNEKLYELIKSLFTYYFESSKEGHYTKRKLGDVTTNNRNKINPSINYQVLSAVNTGSLILSDDYFNKQVYSKDLSKYLIVQKEDFAYNPARINIGSIGINNFEFPTCVSPVYVTFSVDPEYINFFKYYFKTEAFKSEVNLRAFGSVRQTLSYQDFSLIEINYPTLELVKKFNKICRQLEIYIDSNECENRKLSELRNLLLPKLYNNEINLDNLK